MNGPLAGVRVLDASQGAGGPYVGGVLADFGADVIKVEPLDGEWGRTLGPPFFEDSAVGVVGLNRNKRSIAIDLKAPEGAEVFRTLVGRSDIVIESFRPGVMDRLGLGYEQMSARRPGLIYASLSAYGQSGPMAAEPGVDGAIQAFSGLMSVTGSPDGDPAKAGVPAADMCAGMQLVQGVLMALYQRMTTGEGAHVTVSLLDAMIAFQQIPLSMYMYSGEVPTAQGSRAPYSAPNEAYRTADGYVMIAAYTPARWHSFCGVIGRPELEHDPRFADNSARLARRNELREEIEERTRLRDSDEWIRLLREADIICSRINTYSDLVEAEQVRTNEVLLAGLVGAPELRTVAPAVRVGDYRLSDAIKPPRVGEHSRDVLLEAGLSHDDVRRLLESHVVKADPQTSPITEGTP